MTLLTFLAVVRPSRIFRIVLSALVVINLYDNSQAVYFPNIHYVIFLFYGDIS